MFFREVITRKSINESNLTSLIIRKCAWIILAFIHNMRFPTVHVITQFCCNRMISRTLMHGNQCNRRMNNWEVVAGWLAPGTGEFTNTSPYFEFPRIVDISKNCYHSAVRERTRSLFFYCTLFRYTRPSPPVIPAWWTINQACDGIVKKISILSFTALYILNENND